MSSRVFVAELSPDPVLRRVLLVSGLLSVVLGIVTICTLPIDGRLGAFGALLWTVLGGIQWRLISTAHMRYQRLRIHYDGRAELLDRGGEWQAATICKECIVLSTFAWLRLKPADGGVYCELVRGDCRTDVQWRRLQVIWRHLGTVA